MQLTPREKQDLSPGNDQSFEFLGSSGGCDIRLWCSLILARMLTGDTEACELYLAEVGSLGKHRRRLFIHPSSNFVVRALLN
jgi:hypothetical protein